MSEVFEIYQDNLKALFSKVSASFESLSDASKREKVLEEIEHNLNEIQNLIKDLEIQITIELPDPNYTLYVKNYKSGYDSYRKRYLKEKERISLEVKMNKIKLTTSSSTVNENIAYNSFDKLEKAKRATIEMENIGNDVMREFDTQKDQIKTITHKVGDMGDQLTTSTGLISEMERREKRNKNILIIFGIALFVIFLGIVIVRLFPKIWTSTPNESAVIELKNESATISDA